MEIFICHNNVIVYNYVINYVIEVMNISKCKNPNYRKQKDQVFDIFYKIFKHNKLDLDLSVLTKEEGETLIEFFSGTVKWK